MLYKYDGELVKEKVQNLGYRAYAWLASSMDYI